MSSSRDGIYESGIVDPGFPVAYPTESFWQSEVHPLGNHRSAWPLDPVDVVVIGAGITGVNIARNLLLKRPDYKVVLVEARSLCSGATGRNGGHIKTRAYASWRSHKETYGIEEAIRLAEFEHGHFEAIRKAAAENGIDCDLVLTEGIDAYYDHATFNNALVDLENMKAHAPKLASHYVVHTDRDYIQRVFKLSERCIGTINVPAASVWPYKLVTGLLNPLVQDGRVNLQTNTIVKAIKDVKGEVLDLGLIQTDRGIIRARHIVHATNAWIGHLIPELRPYVSPVRGNVVHYASTNTPAGNAAQGRSAFGFDSKFSYWLWYGNKDYDYLIQRQSGDVVVGRANLGRRATSDDRQTDLGPMSHLRGLPKEVALSPSPLAATSIDTAWSGILAFTEDGSPFVGRLPFPNRAHQWVCGGYHGYGMTKAFRTAELVVLMILDDEVPEEYPRSMFLTEERLRLMAQGNVKVNGLSKL